MNLSKIISKYKIILIIFVLIYIAIYYLFFNYSNFSKDEKEFLVYISSYKIDDNLLTITGKSKDNVKCYYYFKSEEEISKFKKEYNFGDYIIINGTLRELSNNTIPNTFNYKKYALTKNEFYSITVNSFTKYKSTIRSYLYKRVKSLDNPYLDSFLFGSNLDNNDYQVIGLSSLFTSFSIILIILKKNNKLYLPILLFLLISTNFNIKIIILILILILKKYKVDYKDIVLIITLVKLIDRPLLFTTISFYYSIIIYLTILLNKKSINKIAFIYLINLSLIPLNIFNNYNFNLIYFLITPVFSILFIPIGFLLSFVLFIIPNFTFLLKYYNFLDYLSSLLVKLEKLSVIIMKPSIIVLLLIYILFFIYLYNRQNGYLLAIISIYLILLMIPHIYNYHDVYYLDVGQGDSSLLRLNNLNILIDTGDKNEEKIITFLYSLGISKLDYIIITHGEKDHMGKSIDIVNDIKVNNVIFNCGPYNDLEKELIQLLKKKDIYYSSCNKELIINNIKLQFLYTREYDNENDNSNVIYLEFNNHKLLFMGDAGAEREKDILNKYNLKDIDFLKVGHHGSKTSSSNEFINKISPEYSIISVGKNNKYGHPNKEVLDILKASEIYRTDEDGSVMFKIKDNRLKIETFEP